MFRSRSIQSDWRNLYLAAILEPNKSAAYRKVCEAEAAMLAREQELSQSPGTDDEKEVLQKALYLLHAYRNAQDYLQRR